MSDIFISHIHEDEIAANALCRFIRAKLRSQSPREHPFGSISASNRSPEIFLSSTELTLGDEFLEKIRASLRASRVVIALFSPEAVKRPWVNFEAGGAWFAADKKLIPLCIGGLNPAQLPKPYSNIQGANLHDLGTPYYLIEALWKILAISALTPPPFPLNDSEVLELQQELERWVQHRKSVAELLGYALGHDSAGES